MLQWITILLLAVMATACQTMFGSRVAIATIAPDGLLVAALCLALYGKPVNGLVAAWLLGLMADLYTLEPIGLFSTGYLLAGVMAQQVRKVLPRYRLSTLVICVLLASAVLRSGLCIYRYTMHDERLSVAWCVQFIGIGTVYTALWSCLLGWLWLRVAPVLGLPHPRYTHGDLSWSNRHV